MQLTRSTKRFRSRRSVGAILASAVPMLVCSCSGVGGGGGGAGGDGNDNTAPDAAAPRRDLWITESSGESGQDFSTAPIPAGFFDFNGRQCGIFDGTARFGGAPISQDTLGVADTFVDRSGDPIAPSDPVGTIRAVDIEIVALNMRSLDPVTVMCEGEPTQWNVRVELSDTPAPKGTLTATKKFDNGGTALSVLFVMPRLIFTSIDDPTVERVLDVGEQGGEPIEFRATIPWVHALDPNNPDPDLTFILGVDGSPAVLKQILQSNGDSDDVCDFITCEEGWTCAPETGECCDPETGECVPGALGAGGGTLIPCVEHFNPTGSHLHNTCAADTDGDGITDGVDNCRFEPNPGQEDEDGDTFGDLCDPCLDDPNCPASGEECEEICPELNSQTCALIEPVYEVLCIFITECVCLPPECDPDSFEGPSDLCRMDPFSDESLAELESVSEQFISRGCDRCILDPCPPPPCEFPEFDTCDFIACPEGKTCDPETQECCDPQTGECCDYMAGECLDICGFVTCGEGQTCNPDTGICE